MAVRSRELINGKTTAQIRAEQQAAKYAAFRASLGYRALGLFMVIVGIIFWTLGAYYSLAGWVRFLNFMLSLFHAQPVFTVPTGSSAFLPTLLLGLVYSYAEVKVRPQDASFSELGYQAALAMWFGMLMLHGSDVGSTLLEVFTLQEGAWALQVWAVELMLPGVIWTILLTYGPELLMIFGYRLIRNIPLRPPTLEMESENDKNNDSTNATDLMQRIQDRRVYRQGQES